MWTGGTLDLLGCTFSENLATISVDDIHNNWGGTVKIYGCPAGSSGAAGAPLDTLNDYELDDYAYGYDDDGDYGDIGTITGEKKSYSCGACVR